MKVYTDRKTAPLKFHKFLIWFSLPLGVLVSLVNAMRYVSAGYPADIFFFFDMGYQLLFISLTVLSIIGLWRYHRSGPLLLYARQILSICYCLLAILIFNVYELSTSEFSSSLSRAITWLVIFVVYYQKRMPLFSSGSTSSQSGSNAPQRSDPLSPVPPVLYAEPEKIPRKYSGTLYTLTGKTQNDLEVLQSLFEHSSAKASSVMDQMDEIGNNPDSPEHESLAHKFLSASYVKQCTSYMFAAIIPKEGSMPRQELFPDLLRNVQFEWDNMCDLIKDLQFLQVELAALSDDSPRQTDLKAQISKLEENISDSQIRIYRLYRM